jgi:pyridoxamine 5'-phosphate oxidase
MLQELMKIVLFSVAARCSMSLLRFHSIKQNRKALVAASTPSSSSNQQSGKLTTVTTVSDLRKEYSKQGLEESNPLVQRGPFALFTAWLEDAMNAKVIEPNAMCLSTCKNNRPSARYVLLKGYDERGFVWYTNYNSRKSKEIEENPFASLTFWWGDLERSVRIEGHVEKVSVEESTEYFHSRPRSSQIGAWSSQQSTIIASRNQLEEQEIKIKEQFVNSDIIPKPEHWGGFRLIPSRMEFWKGRESRLHDRLVFIRSEETNEWSLERLQP